MQDLDVDIEILQRLVSFKFCLKVFLSEKDLRMSKRRNIKNIYFANLLIICLKLCQTHSLSLSLFAVSDITVWHWCSASLQHPLPASGPVQPHHSNTKPIMHCHGRAHTTKRETRKDTFLQRRRLSGQPTAELTLASCVLLVQCALTLVLWTQTPASYSFSPSDQGTFSIWWRQIK